MNYQILSSIMKVSRGLRRHIRGLTNIDESLNWEEQYKTVTARKSGNILLTYIKAFSSDTHQSMKTSNSALKVNRTIYPDAVNVIGCV